jgi:hypothetical protein
LSKSVLEYDMRALVLESFFDQFVRDGVKQLLEPPGLLATDTLDVLVCPPSPDLLQVATPLLVLSMPVIEFAAAPERTS